MFKIISLSIMEIKLFNLQEFQAIIPRYSNLAQNMEKFAGTAGSIQG
jgi:hypothetical protein